MASAFQHAFLPFLLFWTPTPTQLTAHTVGTLQKKTFRHQAHLITSDRPAACVPSSSSRTSTSLALPSRYAGRWNNLVSSGRTKGSRGKNLPLSSPVSTYTLEYITLCFDAMAPRACLHATWYVRALCTPRVSAMAGTTTLEHIDLPGRCSCWFSVT